MATSEPTRTPDAAWVDPSCGCERSPDVPKGTPCPVHAAAIDLATVADVLGDVKEV